MIDNHSVNWNKEALKNLRLRLGWSRSDLARRLHCSYDLVESWESGADIESRAKSELQVLLVQAQALGDEVKSLPAAENECERKALEQIDFSKVKLDLE
ncbi:helix-turn-helix domain-containing protein [Bdellovibrio reynosensis]|uniref:Helix-turn-helix domain-containing protein n=1 Tax=Bdellovibrio reynosensis TaxID=2835041 RepID=A0ABY4C746_9BACT|nr:helix-turn-helix transcriptional regulator [Bdellovibrio reynosensis]UOE99731.1 helix-turn-helix domain-containing protein [Bdellovibrio reynosensis]